MPCLLALQAVGEVQSLIAALRRWRGEQAAMALANSSFFDSPSATEAARQRTSDRDFLLLVGNLCKMRERLHSCIRIEEINALEFMTPILDVVRSVEAGARPTGVALATIHRMASAGIISPVAPSAQATVIAIINNVVGFQFEPTGTGSDEVAVMLLIDALLSVMRCPAGRLLDDDSVWKAVYTTLSITVGTSYADMLRGAASQTLGEMLRLVFHNVYVAPPNSNVKYGKTVAHRIFKLLVSKLDTKALERASNPGVALAWQVNCLQLLLCVIESSSTDGRKTSAFGQVNESRPNIIGGTSLTITKDPVLLELIREDLFLQLLTIAQVAGRGHGHAAGGDAASTSAGNGGASGGKKAAHGSTSSKISGGGGGTGEGEGGGTPGSGGGVVDLRNAGAWSGDTSNLIAISYALRLACLLVSIPDMRANLKVQVEVLFNCVFLRVLEGKSASQSEAQVVLESLADLMADPLLVVDLYVNYDADVRCSNVCQNLFTYLSRHAFPQRLQHPALDRLQLLSLRSIIYGIQGMSERCDTLATLPVVSDLVHGSNGSVGGRGGNGEKDQKVEGEEEERLSAATADDDEFLPFVSAQTLRERKESKYTLHQCAVAFNKKSKLGIAALREAGVLASEAGPTDAKRLAAFIRDTKSLDRNAVGTFFGQPAELSLSTLREFVHTFNMSGQTLLSGLRMFLESFRLPGEGQQIERILELFAEVAHAECTDAVHMATVDCAYLFTVAIIMLNTDLHNRNISKDKKMSFEQFVKQNKEYGDTVSQGKELPYELLDEVYTQIQEREINTMSEGSALTSEITAEKWRDLVSAPHDVKAQGQMNVHCLLEPCNRGPQLVNGELVHIASYDKQILEIVWSPAVAAMSVVFDSGKASQQPGALKAALDGFLATAKTAATYNMSTVFDAITISLSKFTTLLLYAPHTSNTGAIGDAIDTGGEGGGNGGNYGAVNGDGEVNAAAATAAAAAVSRAVKKFDDDHKAQMATMCVFAISRRFGDQMQTSWSYVVYCLLRLCDLSLVPHTMVTELDSALATSEERLGFHEFVKETCFGLVRDRVRRHCEQQEQNSSWLSTWLFGMNKEDMFEQLLHTDPQYITLNNAAILNDAGLGLGIQRYISTNAHNNNNNNHNNSTAPASPTPVSNGSNSVPDNNNNNNNNNSMQGQTQRDSEVDDNVDSQTQPDNEEQSQSDTVAIPAPVATYASAAATGTSNQPTQQSRPRSNSESSSQQQQQQAHVLRAAPNCIRSCRLQQLIDDTDKLSDSALCSFLQALTFASGGSRPRGHTNEQAPNSSNQAPDAQQQEPTDEGRNGVDMLTPPTMTGKLFAVHLLTIVAARNVHRINVVWPLVGPHLLRLVETAGLQPSLAVEKAAVGILQLALFALNVDATTESQVADLDTFAGSMIVAFEHLVKLNAKSVPGLREMVGFTCWRIAVKGRWFPSLPSSTPASNSENEEKALRGEPVGGWDVLLRFLRGCAEIPSDGLFQYNARLVRHLVEQQERIAVAASSSSSSLATESNSKGVFMFVPPRALMYTLSAYAKAAWRFPHDVDTLSGLRRDATPFALEMAIIETLKNVHVLMLPALRRSGRNTAMSGGSSDVDEDTVLVSKSPETAGCDYSDDVQEQEMRSTVVANAWIPLVLELSHVVNEVGWRQTEVSAMAAKTVKRCLLDEHGSYLTPSEWAELLDQVVFPMIHGVLQWRAQFTEVAGPPVSTKPAASADDNDSPPPQPKVLAGAAAMTQAVHVSISKVELTMVEMLAKIMVQHAQEMLDLPDEAFDKIWMRTLGAMERFKHDGVLTRDKAGLLEVVAEHVKNLLLVAASPPADYGPVIADPAKTNADTPAERRWEPTMKFIENTFPGVRNHLFPVNLTERARESSGSVSLSESLVAAAVEAAITEATEGGESAPAVQNEEVKGTEVMVSEDADVNSEGGVYDAVEGQRQDELMEEVEEHEQEEVEVDEHVGKEEEEEVSAGGAEAQDAADGVHGVDSGVEVAGQEEEEAEKPKLLEKRD